MGNKVSILISSLCNLDCEYCFAKKFRQCTDIPKFITFEDFKNAVQWILKNDAENITLLGGEPLLHPEFNKISNYLVDIRNNNKICTALFTNGINISEDNIDLIDTYDSILINFNNPKNIGIDNISKTVTSLKTLNYHNILDKKCTLGYNLYAGDDDFDYLWRTVEKFDIKKIRFSIATPLNNEYYNKNRDLYCLDMKPSFFKFVEEAFERNIMIKWDCSYIPLCYFNEKELNRLFNMYPDYFNKTNVDSCYSICAISTNCKVVPCFGHSEFFSYLKNGKSFYDLSDVDSFIMSVPKLCHGNKCSTCNLYTKTCGGGCLGFAK